MQGWRKPKTRTMLPPMSTKVVTPKQTPPKTLSVAPLETLTPPEPLPSTSSSISPPPTVTVIQSPTSEREATSPIQPATSPQKTPVKNSPSPTHSLKESSSKVKKVPRILNVSFINTVHRNCSCFLSPFFFFFIYSLMN